MNLDVNRKKEMYGWNLKLWLWVFLCSIAIYTTIPLARSFQKLIADSVGREFFTYVVLFVVIAVLTVGLYLLIVKLRVRRVSQYVWLFICGGLFVYSTIQLKEIPEEAVHLLQYSFLAFFVFKAVSYRIRDWTAYPISGLTVLFIGTIDEFLQWLMPARYWGYRDVGINALAGIFFLVAICKVFRPDIISQPVRKYSIKILTWIITLNLLFLGICLSSTPDNVNNYVAAVKSLSWLQEEEIMTEYGYIHEDNEAGIFYSRFTLEELKKRDFKYGEALGRILHQHISSDGKLYGLKKYYTPYANPFLYEFLIHVLRRNSNFEKSLETDNNSERIEKIGIAYRENLFIEKYFNKTLEHSGLKWTDKILTEVKNTASPQGSNYISRVGNIIVLFSMKSAWIVILAMLFIVWISAEFWKRKLSDD